MTKVVKLDQTKTNAFIHLMREFASVNYFGMPPYSVVLPDLGVSYRISMYEAEYGYVILAEFKKPVQLFGCKSATRKYTAGAGLYYEIQASWLGF